MFLLIKQWRLCTLYYINCTKYRVQLETVAIHIASIPGLELFPLFVIKQWFGLKLSTHLRNYITLSRKIVKPTVRVIWGLHSNNHKLFTITNDSNTTFSLKFLHNRKKSDDWYPDRTGKSSTCYRKKYFSINWHNLQRFARHWFALNSI